MVAQAATAAIMESSRQPMVKSKPSANNVTDRTSQNSSDMQSNAKQKEHHTEAKKSKTSSSKNSSSKTESERKSLSKIEKLEKSRKSMDNDSEAKKSKPSSSKNSSNKTESERKSLSKIEKLENSRESMGNDSKSKVSRHSSIRDKKMDSKSISRTKNESKLKKRDQNDDRRADQSEKQQKNKDNVIDFSMIESKIFEGYSLDKQGKESGRKSKPININLTKEQLIECNKRTADRSKVNKTVVKKSGANESKRKTGDNSDRKGKDTKTSSKSTPISNRSYKNKGHLSSDKKKLNNKTKVKQESEDSDMSDWEALEDVNEMDLLLGDSRDTVAHDAGDKEVVAKIELDAPDLWGMKKRKKRSEEDMIEDYMRKCANQEIRDVWENMHKAHLLCLFAHGHYINMKLNSELLLGSALSIVTDRKVYPPKRLDMKFLESFTSWFARKIMLIPQKLDQNYWNTPIEEVLQDRFEQKKAYSNREFVLMFILLSRSLGMTVRLVMTFLPVSWKPTMDNLIRPKKKEDNDLFKDDFGAGSSTASSSQGITMDMVEGLKSREKHQKQEKEKNNKVTKEKKTNNKNSRKMISTDSEDEEKIHKKTKSKKRKSPTKDCSDDSFDDDFDPESSKIKKGPKSTKKGKDNEKNQNKRKAEEREKEEKSRKRRRDGLTEWTEVYVEEEEKWVCVDVIRGKIHCVAEIESRAPPPVAYVTAYNADQTVKDVTPRYNSTWLSSEDKVRCASGWWSKSLRPFRGARTRKDKEEDKEMQQSLVKAPLPGTISQYKNHPMYALQRHILKFEAIYPPDITPLGFLKKEPVFPRDAVKTLRSMNLWGREARTVRTGEEPFKIVKAMPKWDKATRTCITDRPLELFGEWQTEPYEPGVAIDGKVPRNEYGNVELYKQCMMPRGCIQLYIPGVNRVCKTLEIDCAPAMTGFEYHKGGMHPVYEGFIICEEFKDIVLDAWNQEMVELAKKEEEKRQNRIYDNWKRLIKGIVTKHRVRERYGKMTPEEREADLKQFEEEKKNREAEKRRIKQADLDAAVPQGEAETSRPQIITHHVPQRTIDFNCSIVDMARKSRELSMKSKNVARKRPVKRKDSSGKIKNPGNEDSRSSNVKVHAEVSTLESEEEEEDPEEKKARIRSILNWGTENQTNPNLSEDSGDDENSKDSSSGGLDFSGFLNPTTESSQPYHSTKSKAVSTAKSKVSKLKKQVRKKRKSESEKSVASKRSTSPESGTEEPIIDKRRQPRRSAIQKKTYKEIENESEADISLDESDCEDKAYNPKNDKFESIKLSDNLMLSEESE